MDIPEKFQTKEFWSRVFIWAKSALTRVGFSASQYGTDYLSAAQDIVQDAYTTIKQKSEDYPLQLAEERARAQAEQLTSGYFAAQLMAEVDPMMLEAKFEEFFTPLFEQRKKESGTDDWWIRLIRKTLNNHALNLKRKNQRPMEKIGTQVTYVNRRNREDAQEIEIIENISESQVAQTRLASPAHVPSGFEKTSWTETWHEVEAACRRVVKKRNGSENDEKEAAFIEIVRRVYFEDESVREAHRRVCPENHPFSRNGAHRYHGDLLDELRLLWTRGDLTPQ